jgi:hypothetical protein
VIRFILGFLFVLGLVTAWCSQLGEGVLITATSSIRQAIDGQEQKPKIEQVRETVGNLESNLWLWKATLYAGIAVVGCSLIGFSVLPKAAIQWGIIICYATICSYPIPFGLAFFLTFDSSKLRIWSRD